MRPAGLVFALLLASAGCVAPSAGPEPSADTPVVAPAPWSEALRVFEVPPGDSYGALVIEFAKDETLGDGTAYGVAARRSGFAEDAAAQVLLFKLEGTSFVRLPVSTSGRADGDFFAASGDGSEAPTYLALVLLHAPVGGRLEITAWTDDDREANFERPSIPSEWRAQGPASHAIYQQVAGQAPYVVGFDADATTADALVASAGRVTIKSEHTMPDATLEIASGLVFGTASGSAQRIAWTNEGETRSVRFPTGTGAFVSASRPGFQIIEPGAGESGLTIEIEGAIASGAISLMHSSLSLDPAALGAEVASEFTTADPAVDTIIS